MFLDDPPICKLCKQPIANDERWEYTKSSYPLGTPEANKQRAHKSCVSKVLQEAIKRLGKV